jgi:coiled-coil domain-containing protein 130
MQGFNMGRYYPPDASNAPAFNSSSHPLGKRANKLSQGILTVRFELPFAVWCDHCKPTAIVGQGVRFNAEKKKVGNYHSTPIWSFRMKHSACGGWWEIRTDPKNTEYVVVEGAKKRDYGPEVEGEGDLKFLTAEEKEKRRTDAFANLEGKIEEKGLEKTNGQRVEELYEKAEVWRDPYEINARLRQGFRAKRKVWKREERHKEGMQDKFSLGIEIADETEADRVRAKVVEFGGNEGLDWKPLFETADTKTVAKSVSGTKKLKSEIKADQSRRSLQQALVSNTKAAIDPFLSNGNSFTTKPSFGVLRRKKDSNVDGHTKMVQPDALLVEHVGAQKTLATKPGSIAALVDYDSD